jgi:hypothetical protein
VCAATAVQTIRPNATAARESATETTDRMPTAHLSLNNDLLVRPSEMQRDRECPCPDLSVSTFLDSSTDTENSHGRWQNAWGTRQRRRGRRTHLTRSSVSRNLFRSSSGKHSATAVAYVRSVRIAVMQSMVNPWAPPRAPYSIASDQSCHCLCFLAPRGEDRRCTWSSSGGCSNSVFGSVVPLFVLTIPAARINASTRSLRATTTTRLSSSVA